jgi:hypothetical protein
MYVCKVVVLYCVHICTTVNHVFIALIHCYPCIDNVPTFNYAYMYCMCELTFIVMIMTFMDLPSDIYGGGIDIYGGGFDINGSTFP